MKKKIWVLTFVLGLHMAKIVLPCIKVISWKIQNVHHLVSLSAFLWNCVICDVLALWIIRRNGPACPSYLRLHCQSQVKVHLLSKESIELSKAFLWLDPLGRGQGQKSPPSGKLCILTLAVLVNLVPLASPPFWFSIWQSQKRAHVCGCTWPPHGQDGFLLKVTLKNSNSSYLLVKCMFSVQVQQVQTCHFQDHLSIKSRVSIV